MNKEAVMTQLITHVSPQSLTDVLQAAGYRVNPSEQNGIVQLLSASQGIGYAVRFGNAAVEQGSYVDFTFSCALRVQGELPQGWPNSGTPRGALRGCRCKASFWSWKWTWWWLRV